MIIIISRSYVVHKYDTTYSLLRFNRFAAYCTAGGSFKTVKGITKSRFSLFS